MSFFKKHFSIGLSVLKRLLVIKNSSYYSLMMNTASPFYAFSTFAWKKNLNYIQSSNIVPKNVAAANNSSFIGQFFKNFSFFQTNPKASGTKTSFNNPVSSKYQQNALARSYEANVFRSAINNLTYLFSKNRNRNFYDGISPAFTTTTIALLNARVTKSATSNAISDYFDSKSYYEKLADSPLWYSVYKQRHLPILQQQQILMNTVSAIQLPIEMKHQNDFKQEYFNSNENSWIGQHSTPRFGITRFRPTVGVGLAMFSTLNGWLTFSFNAPTSIDDTGSSVDENLLPITSLANEQQLRVDVHHDEQPQIEVNHELEHDNHDGYLDSTLRILRHLDDLRELSSEEDSSSIGLSSYMSTSSASDLNSSTFMMSPYVMENTTSFWEDIPLGDGEKAEEYSSDGSVNSIGSDPILNWIYHHGEEADEDSDGFVQLN